MQVIAPPSPLPATDGRRHLAYEILVRNTTRARVTLNRLEVRNGTGRRLLAAYFDGAIAQRMVNAATRSPTRTLAAGQLGMIVLDVTLAPGRAAPGAAPAPPRARPAAERDPHAPGDRGARPHARGEASARSASRRPCAASTSRVFGCCGRPFAHRLALGLFAPASRSSPSATRSTSCASTRWSRRTRAIRPSTRTTSSTATRSSPSAAGRIAATRDGIPENTPPGAPPNPAPNDLAGNFVNQDLGGGRFALYAHLQPGSLRVRPGDVVQPGQVLGLVGNSGNSVGAAPALPRHGRPGRRLQPRRRRACPTRSTAWRCSRASPGWTRSRPLRCATR